MTINPSDIDPRLVQLEALVKEKVRGATSTEERARLMELLPYLASLRDFSRLREALIKTQRKLDEAQSPPLEYGVFLGVCPPRQTNAEPEEDGVWQHLSRILREVTARETDPDERQRLGELHDYLRELLVTGRDVLVGVNGQRLEVRLAYTDAAPEHLHEGQQVVLNKYRNVVGTRTDFLRGETAEVVNILSPNGTAKVVALPDEDNGLRVQWPDGERFDVQADESLLGALRRGDVVQLDEAGERALARVKPRLHVRAGSTETVVEISEALFKDGIEIGDLVRVDTRLQFAYEKLPSQETGSLTLEEVPDVKYEDIGGLDEQIGQIQDAIELPYIYRHLFDEYQLPRPKGILLFGPPGCGKTMIAKAVANNLTVGIRLHLSRLATLIGLYTRLRKGDPDAADEYRALSPMNPNAQFDGNGANGANGVNGLDSEHILAALAEELRLNDIDTDDLPSALAHIHEVLRRQDGIRSYFLNVKGPELLTKWVGETEHRIRKIFEEAKSRASYYTPVVIFFDEMEAMFRTRGSGRSSDVETTIVPQFLSEMDGVEVSENVIIIGASNRADMIDPAIMRPGRLDIKIRINRPTLESAMQIMALYLTPDLPLDVRGLVPPRYGQNLTFKADAVRRTVRMLCTGEQADAILNALPAKQDIRHALDAAEPEGAALRELATADPVIAARLEAVAAREQAAEALIVETINLLFSPTSRMETSLRGQGNAPDERLVFALKDFASGAMLMSVVSRAKKRALKRRILPPGAGAAEAGAGQGIDIDDLRAALQDEFNENAEQFVGNWMMENVGAARPGDIRGVRVYLEAVDEDPWGMEKAKPYRQEKRVGVSS